MKKQMILILLMTFSLAVGCAETPSQVQEEISVLNENSIAHEESSAATDIGDTLQYGTMEEIRADAEAVLENSKGNFRIESLLLPDAEQMHAYSLERLHDESFQSWLFEIYDDFYGEPLAQDAEGIEVFEKTDNLTQYDGFDISERKLSSHMHSISVERQISDEISTSLSVSAYDRIVFWRSFDMIVSPYLLTTIPEVKTYRYDTWEGISYPMYEGGEWLISDAAAYVTTFFNEISPNEAFTYAVESVTVRRIEEAEEEAYGYWFLMKRVAEDGVEVYPIYDLNGSEVNSKSDFAFMDFQWAWCVRTNEIHELEKAADFSVIDSAAAESLLTLSQAKKIAEETMASGRVYYVDCRLAYCMRLYGSWVSEKTGTPFLEAVEYGDYTELRMEPYWIFTEMNDGREVRYLVNARTGEFEVR